MKYHYVDIGTCDFDTSADITKAEKIYMLTSLCCSDIIGAFT